MMFKVLNDILSNHHDQIIFYCLMLQFVLAVIAIIFLCFYARSLPQDAKEKEKEKDSSPGLTTSPVAGTTNSLPEAPVTVDTGPGSSPVKTISSGTNTAASTSPSASFSPKNSSNSGSNSGNNSNKNNNNDSNTSDNGNKYNKNNTSSPGPASPTPSSSSAYSPQPMTINTNGTASKTNSPTSSPPNSPFQSNLSTPCSTPSPYNSKDDIELQSFIGGLRSIGINCKSGGKERVLKLDASGNLKFKGSGFVFPPKICQLYDKKCSVLNPEPSTIIIDSMGKAGCVYLNFDKNRSEKRHSGIPQDVEKIFKLLEKTSKRSAEYVIKYASSGNDDFNKRN